MLEVIFLGANRRVGTSRKTGKPYDICELVYGRPVMNKSTDDYRYSGHGVEPRTIKLDPEGLDQFEGVKVGSTVKLSMSPNPDNFERNMVSGLVK